MLSTPNGRRLDGALGTLEHVVAIDGYLNETTRHAHVVLPPAPPLSRAHYDLALYAFAVRNVAKYSDPVIPRASSERHDWDILTELAGRVFVPRPLRALALLGARRLRPERLVDVLLRVGPHGLTLRALRRSPHGVDLGPLEPGRFPARIATPDRMADVAPDDFVREARRRLLADADSGTQRDTDDGAEAGLVLIGRRQLRDKNSWLHNVPRLVKGPSRCTLLVHPIDAESRGLASGDLARLTSTAGAIVVPVEVTDEMRPGVVSLPHGWGHDRDGIRLSIAHAHQGASANDVTSEMHLDTLSGNAAFNGLAVTLHRADAATRESACIVPR